MRQVTAITNAVASIAVAALALWPQLASADALLPYLWVPFGQVLLFPLVVMLEGIVLWRMLQGGFFRACWHSLLINLGSTLVGAILYVVTMPLIGQFLYNIWQQAWLRSATTLSWSEAKSTSIILAAIFAFVLFGVSWLVEAQLLKYLRRSTPSKSIYSACGVANALSYAVLLALTAWVA